MAETLMYERFYSKALLAAIRLDKGERLLALQPFGWHIDGVHIPNAPEQFSREGICEEHGWVVVDDFGPYVAIVRAKPVEDSVAALAALPHAEAPPTPTKAEGSCLLCGHLKPFAVFVNGRIDDPLRPVWIGCCEDCRRRASARPSDALRVLAAELRDAINADWHQTSKLESVADKLDELAGSGARRE